MANKPVLLRCPTCLKNKGRSVRVGIDEVYNCAGCLVLDVTCEEGHENTIEIDHRLPAMRIQTERR